VNEKLFYPFGELWTGASIPNLGMHQTFAQLPDYDPETDQYNTANRHYSPSGRWMSPDPDNAGATPIDPQTWNMYAYVRNNPTSFVDPNGTKYCRVVTGKDGKESFGNCVSDRDYGNNPSQYPGYKQVSPDQTVYVVSGPTVAKTYTVSIETLRLTHFGMTRKPGIPEVPTIQALPPPQPLTTGDKAGELAACIAGLKAEQLTGKSPTGDEAASVDQKAPVSYAPRYSKTGPQTEEVPMMNPEATGAANDFALSAAYLSDVAACEAAVANGNK
jgi:RHS repeat-associated protein